MVNILNEGDRTYLPVAKKPNESCSNYEGFLETRAKILGPLRIYSASADAGVRDAYCISVCPNKDSCSANETYDKISGDIETKALQRQVLINKYFRSEEAKQDVGLEFAITDFLKHHLPFWSLGFESCISVYKPLNKTKIHFRENLEPSL